MKQLLEANKYDVTVFDIREFGDSRVKCIIGDLRIVDDVNKACAGKCNLRNWLLHLCVLLDCNACAVLCYAASPGVHLAPRVHSQVKAQRAHQAPLMSMPSCAVTTARVSCVVCMSVSSKASARIKLSATTSLTTYTDVALTLSFLIITSLQD